MIMTKGICYMNSYSHKLWFTQGSRCFEWAALCIKTHATQCTHIAVLHWPSSGPHKPFSLCPHATKHDGLGWPRICITVKGHTCQIKGRNWHWTRPEQVLTWVPNLCHKLTTLIPAFNQNSRNWAIARQNHAQIVRTNLSQERIHKLEFSKTHLHTTDSFNMNLTTLA